MNDFMNKLPRFYLIVGDEIWFAGTFFECLIEKSRLLDDFKSTEEYYMEEIENIIIESCYAV